MHSIHTKSAATPAQINPEVKSSKNNGHKTAKPRQVREEVCVARLAICQTKMRWPRRGV